MYSAFVPRLAPETLPHRPPPGIGWSLTSPHRERISLVWCLRRFQVSHGHQGSSAGRASAGWANSKGARAGLTGQGNMYRLGR